IDLTFAVTLDVPKLAGRRVVERKDDRRHPGRDVDIAVDELRDGDGPVAARIHELEVTPEMLGTPAPAAVPITTDEVVLEDRDASTFVDGTRVLRLCRRAGGHECGR